MNPDTVERTDAVWRALANPVRRRILDLLTDGPVITGALADAFPELSRFAVMQHLKVLEEAELVVPRRDGRLRYNHLNAVPIQRIYRRWVSRYAGRWADSLLGLKEELEAESDGESEARRGTGA
jgi:DNA-binding transcriptional ArsR family regulator